MKINKKINVFWFTLIELIIVIVILAILATIAFLSFNWYVKSSRDSKRLSEIKIIYEASLIYKEKTWIYPDWDNVLDLYSYWKQWYVWDNMKKILNITWDLVDPLDQKKYTYLVDYTWKKIQIWTYLENKNILSYFINKSYADNIDYKNRFFYVIWDNIWILTTSDTNEVLQSVLTWTVVLSSYTWWLNTYYNNSTSISWTWWDIISQINSISNLQINTWSWACTLWVNFVLWWCKL